MKNNFSKLEELIDKNNNLLKISIDYCINNIDKSKEISCLLTILEVILEEQLKIKSITELIEMNYPLVNDNKIS